MRLFHISDLHFGLEDREALAWFRECVRCEQPDAVLITGDLTMRARSREFAAACDWIMALDLPVTVEVGNHDELIALEGHYYRLYQAQARNAEDDAPPVSPDLAVDDDEGDNA